MDVEVECPECLAKFEIPDDVMVGELVDCPECGVELEVSEVGSSGAKLKVASVEAEDWGE